MNNFFSRLIISLFCIFYAIPSGSVFGQDQQPNTITGNGTIGDGVALIMSFPPVGGPVSGHVYWEGNLVTGTGNSSSESGCPGTAEMNMTGEFSGGDGGSITGTFIYTINAECLTQPVVIPGTWSGLLFANGNGSGTAFADSEIFGGDTVSWQMDFSADEFASALPGTPPMEAETEVVTSEYIYNTYGIRVEDSFGDDQYAQTSWSDEELGWLNDVLKELPPDLIKNMKIKSFIRNKVSIDKDGNQNPNTNGTYFICGENDDPEKCDGSEAAIRIYDNALVPTAANPDPATKFKGTILHELIHSLQYNNTRDNPTDAYSTPLLYNYMDAVTTSNANGRDAGWEYKQAPGAPPPPKWQLTSSQSPPTPYGKISPKEDMCESVRMYMLNPRELKFSSPKRYAFIRDEMFGGVEYENGVQKK